MIKNLTLFFVTVGFLSLATQSSWAYRATPVGIIDLQARDETPDQLAADPGWTNANVSGFEIRASWAVVEPSNGTYNWALFDEAVTLATQYDKVLGFELCAGKNSPTWIYNAGAVQYSFTDDVNSGGTIKIMPEPWDPVFQGFWRSMVIALAQRYDNNNSAANQHIGYIWMTGIGRDNEMSFVSTPADITTFDNMNGQALWQKAVGTIAGYYLNNFWHTICIYSMAPPTPDDTGMATVATAVQSLLTNQTPHFGICDSALYAGSNTGKQTDAFIQANYKTNLVGFQMDLPEKSLSQPLSSALTAGINLGGHYVEVYSADCADPNQQSTLANANVGLVANAQNAP